jgi:hypothetical protein
MTEPPAFLADFVREKEFCADALRGCWRRHRVPHDQAGGRDCATAARLYRYRRAPKPAAAPGVPLARRYRIPKANSTRTENRNSFRV